MATYYVWEGATTGANNGTNWDNAFLTYGQGVTSATQSGDIIKVHYQHTEDLGGNTTYTFTNNANTISVDKDNADALTPMDTTGYIGHSSLNRNITITGAFKLYFYGMTWRTASSTAANLNINSGGDGAHHEYENNFFWHGCTNNSATFIIGSDNANTYSNFINCTFRLGNASQSIDARSLRLNFEGCSLATTGSAPTTLFDDGGTSSGPDVRHNGCDWSHCTGTLVGNMTVAARTWMFSQCKINATTILATQSNVNKSSGVVYLYDCNNGDVHTYFAYYDAFGSCVSDTTNYYTTGAARQSWRITTVANACSTTTPFVSPFIDAYNSNTTTAVTPYIEIVRLNSTSSFSNVQVWGDFWIKTTSSSTRTTEYSDRGTIFTSGSAQSAGAGTGSWTLTTTTAWSGKVDTVNAVTPAEVGAIRGRIVVGEAGITVYADPQIRT